VDNLIVKPTFKLILLNYIDEHFKGVSSYVTSTSNNWRTMADREHNCHHGNVPSILLARNLDNKANVSQVFEIFCSNNVRNARKVSNNDSRRHCCAF